MEILCKSCHSDQIKKNGHIHNGKQRYKCLSCGRQFVNNSTKKVISEETKEKVRKALLEKISLRGICRLFSVSMGWLLKFIDTLYSDLPDTLNAQVVAEDEEFEIVTLQADEQWSFVQKKKNPQWLWLIMHAQTRQILAFHVGERNKSSGQKLLAKLPEELKKNPFFTQIDSMFIMKSSPDRNIALSISKAEKRAILKDLIIPCDKDALD
jgi:hypothetical protein